MAVADCIIWQHGRSMGYGITWRNGRVLRAHQAAWLDAGNEIPDGLQLHHACEERWCELAVSRLSQGVLSTHA